MSVPSLLNVQTTPMTPLVVAATTENSAFHAPNTWTSLPDHKLEKVDFYSKDNITPETGGTIRINIDKQNAKIYFAQLHVKLAPLTCDPINEGLAAKIALSEYTIFAMFDKYTSYHGNKDQETRELEADHLWLKLYPSKDHQDNIRYNINTDGNREGYARTEQELFMDLPVFHSTSGPHSTIYLNKLANEFRYEFKLKPLRQYINMENGQNPRCAKIEVFLRCWMVHVNESERLEFTRQIDGPRGIIYPLLHIERKRHSTARAGESRHVVDISHIKGNAAYFLFTLRKKNEVDRENRHFNYQSWNSFRVLHSGNKEIVPAQSFKENFHDLKRWFTLPVGNNNGPAPGTDIKFESGPYNFGGWSWSLNPMDHHHATGNLPTSNLNNLQFELNTAQLDEDCYIDIYFASHQYIQYKGVEMKKLFEY
eukprot:gene9342-11458_t